jgi:hypothetical protein
MRRTLKDVLFGIFIVIVITIFEFLVTLPFGEPVEFGSEQYSQFASRELLLTALPAVLVTFIFTGLIKTRSRSEALRRSIVWTIIIFLNYLLIGIGNDNFKIIFGTIGIYILLACAFLGPIIYEKIKHLE